MKAKILVPDYAGRWQLGEVGIVLENDYKSKYDYLVELPGMMTFEIGRKITAPRQYYFMADEVELLSQNHDSDDQERNH